MKGKYFTVLLLLGLISFVVSASIESGKKPTYRQIYPEGQIIIPENISVNAIIAEFEVFPNDGGKRLSSELGFDKDDFFLVENYPKIYIQVNKNLDYEHINEYNMIIYLENKNKLETQIPVNVKLTDVNDNIPSVTKNNPYSVDIPSGEPSGFKVMQINLSDGDGTEENRKGLFSLKDNADGKFFAIDKNTGVLTTATKIEYNSAKTEYDVVVVCTDSSPNSRGQKVMKSEHGVLIRVKKN